MLFIIYIIFLNSFSCFPLNFLKSVSITTVNLKLAFWLLIHFCVFGFPLWPVLNTRSNYIIFKIYLLWFCVQNCMRIRMAISFTFMSLIFIALSSCCFETRPHYETKVGLNLTCCSSWPWTWCLPASVSKVLRFQALSI